MVSWRDGARLVDAPAQATYCSGDSLLVIIALDRPWGAGLALRGRFPVDSARTFAVRPSLGEDGTAAAAFRAVDDSVRPAILALRGTVRLEAGARATGSFELGAPPLPGQSAPVHLIGAFRGLRTGDSSISCSAWGRIP